MSERIVVVEEAFVARGRGVLVAPRFVLDAPRPPRLQVRLRLPDGQERQTRAELETSHVRGPHGTFAMVRLPDLSPQDVPPGTEIWEAT